MPFKIIRNDITKVKADAIVNTANPSPIVGEGTDYLIYEAAGRDNVLKEREAIGRIKRGEVGVTNAYNLDAKYIIHTVGPIWENGNNNEFKILENCYKNSLNKAKELDCKTIAFPLIATGVYGFPKDKALQIALNVFNEFLLENDMTIILVVYDQKSFQLSSKIVEKIDAYIDANYVSIDDKAKSNELNSDSKDNFDNLKTSDKMQIDPNLPLEKQLENMGLSFNKKLFELIAKSNMTNSEIYGNVNMDRKLFSKIINGRNYHPKKKTVLQLCIGLKLDIEETKDLLARAGYAFDPSSKSDLIIQKFIIDKEYDSYAINSTLFRYNQELLFE